MTLYAVAGEENRGSFLMDHLPVIACHPGERHAAVERALNRLVDESLKGCLWREQSVYLREHGFDWLPAHAPEPVTLLAWLESRGTTANDPQHLWILHRTRRSGPQSNRSLLICARSPAIRGMSTC